MQTTYEIDRSLEDKFALAVKGCLAQVFMRKRESADLEDAQDFAIYRAQPFSVGVRLRRFQFYNPVFRRQFTIRYHRPGDILTEIDKIRAGKVDYIFYGFLGPNAGHIIQFFVGDLRYFMEPEPTPIRVFWNDPPDSELAVYQVDQFPPQFIVAYWNNPNCPGGAPSSCPSLDTISEFRRGVKN